MTKIFDPFNDRTSRDIRNTLSSALVSNLTGNRDQLVADVAQRWLSQVTDAAYQNYIIDIQNRYEHVINLVKVEQILDTRLQAVVLWNASLYFEVHELLETIWHDSQGPERLALKGLIQAAGAYVHLQRGKRVAAQRLADRAANNIRQAPKSLEFIENLDALLTCLNVPLSPPPKLEVSKARLHST